MMRAFSETFVKMVVKQFREGYSTYDISKEMDLEESVIYNALAQRPGRISKRRRKDRVS